MRSERLGERQRGCVQGCRGRLGQLSTRLGTACCYERRAAARQLDAGVELRRSGCEQRGRLDQRAVVGRLVRHGRRPQLRELGPQRRGALGARGGGKH